MSDNLLRVSVSQISSYLTYLTEVISFEQLVKQLTTYEPPTIKMRAGTVFHCEIQGLSYEPHEYDQYIEFSETTLQEAKEKVSNLSDIFEYKIRKVYETKRGPVVVTGVADQIVGDVIHEFKTTYSPFSYDKYADSIQWKAYCHIFGVEQVKYQVWQLSEPKLPEDIKRGSQKPLEIKSYNEFTMYRSKCSDQEFLNALEGVVDLIYMVGIDKVMTHPFDETTFLMPENN